MKSSELLALTGVKPKARFDASPLLAGLGSIAVAVSFFLPWLSIKLSQCVFSVCGATGTQDFSIVQISGTGVLLNLLGGPFKSLAPVVTSYTILALWCLGAIVVGLVFAGWRFQRRKQLKKGVIAALLWSAALVAVVVETFLQMQQTFALQNQASVSFVHVAASSYFQQGPLVLEIGLALLSGAAIFGIVRPKG